MKPLPLPYSRQRPGHDPIVRSVPVGRLYVVSTPRGATMLRGLRDTVWLAAVTALFNEAQPDAIIAELAQLCGDVGARWRGLTREQAMAAEMRRQVERSE